MAKKCHFVIFLIGGVPWDLFFYVKKLKNTAVSNRVDHTLAPDFLGRDEAATKALWRRRHLKLSRERRNGARLCWAVEFRPPGGVGEAIGEGEPRAGLHPHDPEEVPRPALLRQHLAAARPPGTLRSSTCTASFDTRDLLLWDIFLYIAGDITIFRVYFLGELRFVKPFNFCSHKDITGMCFVPPQSGGWGFLRWATSRPNWSTMIFQQMLINMGNTTAILVYMSLEFYGSFCNWCDLKYVTLCVFVLYILFNIWWIFTCCFFKWYFIFYFLLGQIVILEGLLCFLFTWIKMPFVTVYFPLDHFLLITFATEAAHRLHL